MMILISHVCLLWVLASDAPVAQIPEPAKTVPLDEVIAPDPEVQEMFRRFLAGEYKTEAEAKAALDSLRARAGPGNAHVISQLLYLRAQATDMPEAVLIHELMPTLGIKWRDFASVAIPLLGSGNPALEKEVRELLRPLEKRSVGRPPDFSIYEAWIEGYARHKQEPPHGLVRYIFEASPGAALLTMMRAYGLGPEGKPILWAEHVISELLWRQEHGFLEKDQTEPAAVEQLAKMASHEQWWARLYAAEIMRQQREFRDPRLVEKLANDEHPLVRESIALFEVEIERRAEGRNQSQTPGRKRG